MTLTNEDLTAIKGVVQETIQESVPGIVQPMIDRSLEHFAVIVGDGFNEVAERFNQVDAEIAGLKTDVAELKTDMREVKWSLADTVRRAEFLDVRDRVMRLEQRHQA